MCLTMVIVPYGWAYRYGAREVTCIALTMCLVLRGHYETNVTICLKLIYMNVRGKQLVYSVQTKSEDPSNIYVLADDYSRSIIKT